MLSDNSVKQLVGKTCCRDNASVLADSPGRFRWQVVEPLHATVDLQSRSRRGEEFGMERTVRPDRNRHLIGCGKIENSHRSRPRIRCRAGQSDYVREAVCLRRNLDTRRIGRDVDPCQTSLAPIGRGRLRVPRTERDSFRQRRRENDDRYLPHRSDHGFAPS